MKKHIKYVILLLIVTLLIPSLVNAETKKWRLYSYVTKRHVMPVGFVKAPANGIFERRGVAQFEDGEIATILMRGSVKATPKGGGSEGFAQYTFKDGSTKIIKFQVKSVKKEGKKLATLSGEGKYVSGTGRFKGIQGGVTITGKYITPYSKEKGMLGDMIIDATANYSLPSQ